MWIKAFLIVIFLFVNGLPGYAVGESAKGKHGGEVIREKGRDYELVKNVAEQKVQVYTVQGAESIAHSTLVVRVKKNNTIIDRLRLTLNAPHEPNSLSYSAVVPANILIAGGITFEIDF